MTKLLDRLEAQYEELEKRIVERKASKRDFNAYNVIVAMMKMKP